MSLQIDQDRPSGAALRPQSPLSAPAEPVKASVAADLLDPELSRFDLARLSAALKPERDLQFDDLGLQTL